MLAQQFSIHDIPLNATLLLIILGFMGFLILALLKSSNRAIKHLNEALSAERQHNFDLRKLLNNEKEELSSMVGGFSIQNNVDSGFTSRATDADEAEILDLREKNEIRKRRGLAINE
jgi:hypothetical protein